jgi:hypothetical protein
MSDPATIIVPMLDTTIECPSHEGSFDCTPFCRLCEGNQETNLDELLAQADSVSYDGCHKIYLNMDAKQTEKMFGYGYDKTITGTTWDKQDAVWRWYEDSCSLRFIDAVFTNDDDETDKFVTVVSQFQGEDDE